MKRNFFFAGPGIHAWPAILLVIILALTACQPVPVATSPVERPPVLSPTATTEVTVEPTATLPPTVVPSSPTPEPPTPTPEPSLTPTASSTPTPKTLKETDNYLILGIDPRPGDTAWRTDTIMVVAVDHEANQVGIFSIPRDLWVEIPGYGMGRINQADFYGESNKYPGGGPALVGKIIEDILGVSTQHWVRIKQEGLVELVDALGGVDVILNCPLHELTPHPTKPGEFEKFELPAGKNHLDGAAAKKFATFRYNSNDFYRGQRQQQLIWAIKEQALQLDAITKLPQLWRALQHTFQTDLDLLEVVRLARVGAGLSSEEIHGLTFSSQAIVYADVGNAQVLRIGDQALLEKELSGLFAQKSISEQGKIGSNANCPTPTTPTPGPTATESSTASPTPGSTATGASMATPTALPSP
jgi:LCP family protein required for cell wall assembly